VAIAVSVLLQVVVVYVPFMQRAFSTVPLGAGDWLRCLVAASAVLWVREVTKAVGRVRRSSGAARLQVASALQRPGA
jgi:Ca2+-transporting ATPase